MFELSSPTTEGVEFWQGMDTYRKHGAGMCTEALNRQQEEEE